MKLRNKLVFRTVSLASLVFGVFGALLICSAFHLQLENERRTLDHRSAYLAQSIEAAAVNYILQNIPLDEGLLCGVLSSLDHQAQLLPEDSVSAVSGMYLSADSLYAVRSVSLGGDIRYILSHSDLSALYRMRRVLLIGYALIYSVILCLFSLIMLLTARSVSRPVEHLADVSHRLSSGELTARAQPDGTLETHALAQSFNQMADALTGQIERQQRFIADLTHEIKTPLTAIIGHADLIRSGRIQGDDALIAAQSITREGRRLNSLSLRLIDLILMEREEIHLSSVFVRSLLEESVRSLQPAAQNLGVTLSCRSDDALIACDPALFTSLIMNLIDNALKSGAENVQAEGRMESEVFVLTVTDDGRGMDQNTLQHITEPFYRADKSRSRAQGGAGLGLALCAQIARLHRAILQFESTPGKGTSVMISLLGKEAETDKTE